jgi:hypothetical protein
MTAPDPKSLARRRKMMRALNVVMRPVLSLPFRTPMGSRLMLVNYTGRKTGKHYRQPVSYVVDGDVLLTPGGGGWTWSLSAGTPVTARIAGKDVSLRPELVSDPAEVNALLQRMAARNPALKRFVPIPRDDDGNYEAAPLQAAIDHGFCVVRWHRQG